MNSPKQAPNLLDRLLGHWLLAVAMILVAAALTIPQIDKYPLSVDSLHSYAMALGLTESIYTPINVLENLYADAPDQAPLYYLSLHIWGYVVGHSLATARLPALFAGLLSLAMVYRLARDFISPVAGSFAAFVLLCNALYAFYYAHVRYYTFVILLAAIIIWLYLRIVHQQTPANRRDWLTLTAACYALICTHAFGFLLYLVLALYHLLAVRKDLRWVLVVGVAAASILLAAPQLYVMLTAGAESAREYHGPRSSNVTDVLATWLTVISNGSPPLLGILLVGVAVGWRRKLLRGNPILLLFPLLVVSIGLISTATGIVSIGQMRYLLVGTPIVVCFIAASLYALMRLRRWLGLLALLWLVAGIAFMQATDWEPLIRGRRWAYNHPPWHLISRWMQQSDEKLPVMALDVAHNLLSRYTFR